MALSLPKWLDAAENAWLSGRDATVEQLLLDAAANEDPEQVALLMLATARYAAHLDELAVANKHAQRVMEEGAGLLRTWAVLVGYAVNSVPAAQQALPALRLSLSGGPSLGNRVLAWGAAASVATGSWDEARRWLTLAEETPCCLEARLMLLHASAAVAFADERRDQAAAALEEALELAKREGWRRAQARLELEIGMRVEQGAAAIGWIGRASAPLIEMGSWRDRDTLREGFRKHGRRLTDHVLDAEMARPFVQLDQALGALRFSTMDAVGGPHRESCSRLLGEIRSLSAAVAAADKDVGELVGEALVERDRTAMMVAALAELERGRGLDDFAATGAAIAARILDAAHAWFVELRPDGSMLVLGSFPPGTPLSDDDWQSRIHAEELAPPGQRHGRSKLGSALGVSADASPFRGALLAEKGDPRRKFRGHDRVMAVLVGVQLAHGLARLRAGASEKVALTRLEATFAAIREGVLSVDADGVVTSANAAAARMLRNECLVGTRLSEEQSLLGLWDLLSSSPKLDSALLRLAHGTVVVTSRPVGGSSDGVVVTLVEFGRAEQMVRQITAARARYTFDDIVSASDAMREVRGIARMAADVDANLLITGESGTGKEMFAQAVHTGGARAQHPFVGINCAALPRDLLEAELFGYERGAFTGAKQLGQVGKFEQAGQGTLLLDEIGDMPLDMQAKLLRVLQERAVVRLGGSRERIVRARIISTTNRNLEDSVSRSTFRLDLLFRLRVLHIHVPPLRSHPQDIPTLAQHFLLRTARSLNKRVRHVGPHALRELEQHDWPGNVREMANVLEREVTLMPSDATVLERLRGPLAGEWPTEEPRSVRAWKVSLPSSDQASSTPPLAPSSTSPDGTAMADVERQTYLAALSAHDGNVVAAAKSIGVSKSKFYTRLKLWRRQGLAPPSGRGGTG